MLVHVVLEKRSGTLGISASLLCVREGKGFYGKRHGSLQSWSCRSVWRGKGKIDAYGDHLDVELKDFDFVAQGVINSDSLT